MMEPIDDRCCLESKTMTVGHCLVLLPLVKTASFANSLKEKVQIA